MPASSAIGKGKESKKTDYFPHLPQHELESLARCLLPSIEAYFQTDEGKQAFAEWEKQQDQ